MTAALLAQASAATEETDFQWALVLTSWGVVLVSLLALVVRTAQRGRRLSKSVPEDRRRWM